MSVPRVEIRVRAVGRQQVVQFIGIHGYQDSVRMFQKLDWRHGGFFVFFKIQGESWNRLVAATVAS